MANSEVFWSQRFGENLSESWNLGNLLGLGNEARYNAFIGLSRPGDAKNYNDFLGTEFGGIRQFISADTGKIGLSARNCITSLDVSSPCQSD